MKWIEFLPNMIINLDRAKSIKKEFEPYLDQESEVKFKWTITIYLELEGQYYVRYFEDEGSCQRMYEHIKCGLTCIYCQEEFE